MAGITVSARQKAYMRSRAEAHMISTVKIERITEPAWTVGTGLATAGTRTTIYTGKARLWVAGGPSVVGIGNDAELALANINVSIPFGSAEVRRDDTITITASADDATWLNRVLRVETVDGAGLASVSQRFGCSLVVANREWS